MMASIALNMDINANTTIKQKNERVDHTPYLSSEIAKVTYIYKP